MTGQICFCEENSHFYIESEIKGEYYQILTDYFNPLKDDLKHIFNINGDNISNEVILSSKGSFIDFILRNKLYKIIKLNQLKKIII